jgi:hypothetical protein
MRYIIISGSCVLKMEWYDYGTHFTEGAVIVDMLDEKFTTDGVNWLAIQEFEF